MIPVLHTPYFVNKEFSTNEILDLENEKNRRDCINLILIQIQEYVGEVLDILVHFDLSDEIIEQLGLWDNTLKSCTFQLKYNISFILYEILNNALDACNEAGLLRGNRKIKLRVQYNEKKGAITIRMRDNGIGNQSNIPHKKETKSDLNLIGGMDVFEKYLKTFTFVTSHRKVLSRSGAVVQIKISLPAN